MKKFSPEVNSYILSFGIHLVFLIVFFFIKVASTPIEEEYITLGFGSSGFGGIKAMNVEKKIETLEKVEEDVEVPKAKNLDETNSVKTVKEEKKETKPQSLVQDYNKSDNDGEGFGEGGNGFSIDFGGKGKRKIYHHPLPQYPSGVSKEIDIRLRFTILPDGTVTKIIPLIKADSQLENAAINSLSQWRFEPLPKNAKQIPISVIITFPYRLR